MNDQPEIIGIPDMPDGDVLAEKCPSRDILKRVSGRWSLLVFWALRDGQKHRFSELKRAINGVSEKMLAQTLQQLEFDGFIDRTVHPVVPPHVEYQLTKLGTEFGTRVVDLVNWLEDNYKNILLHRAELDASS